MTNPLVSIVIPVYNGENFLRDAIDSALAQTYKNIEVIVVNDGSTDSTDAIAKSYGNKIRYFQKENGGVASAVNHGVAKMKGSYFAWLSHDDYFNPEKIKLQMKAIQDDKRNPEICFSNINVYYVDENRLVKENYLESYREDQLTNSCFAPIFFLIHGSTILVSKKVIEKTGMWDETLKTTQDSVWLFNAMRDRISVFVKESLVTVRIHEKMGQISMIDHFDEFNQMVIGFCKKLKREERINLYGSEYNFYSRYYDVLKGRNKSEACLRYLEQKMVETKSDYQDITPFYIKKVSDRRMKIAIFGMGMYGKIVFDTFDIYQVKVDCFFDNNPKKVGEIYKGVICRPIEELVENEEDYFVIAAIKEPFVLVEEIKAMGIKNVMDKDTACNILYDVARHCHY